MLLYQNFKSRKMSIIGELLVPATDQNQDTAIPALNAIKATYNGTSPVRRTGSHYTQ